MASPAPHLPASPFAMARQAADARRAVEALAPGTPERREAHGVALALANWDLSNRIGGGASAADVAAYVRRAGPVSAALSRQVENEAHPGTFAEAVFTILAD